MVKCGLCGSKIILKRIDEEEAEEQSRYGSYAGKPKGFHGGRESKEKLIQVKIYGCSNPNCISLEMTEKEYLEKKENQSH